MGAVAKRQRTNCICGLVWSYVRCYISRGLTSVFFWPVHCFGGDISRILVVPPGKEEDSKNFMPPAES